MKKLLIILILAAIMPAFGQSRQTRVMLQQIAALKTYGNYLQKGYTIAKDGLTFIGRVKDGELNLHTLFYDGLSQVNPVVRSYPKVHSILQLYQSVTDVKTKVDQQLTSNLFYGNEKDYIRRVFERLLSRCDDDLDALELLLANGSLMADDAQRLARIDSLYVSMEDRYAFAKSFHEKCTMLLASRRHERSDAKQMRQLYNLNPTP